MTTEQSRDFMRSPYEDQRTSSWSELKDLILPAVILAAAGTLAYKGVKRIKNMPALITLPQKLTKEQRALKELQNQIKSSFEGASSDVPYQTANMLEDWMKGMKHV